MRILSGFPVAQYIGAPFVRPIKLGGIAGMSAPLTFNWLSYGAATALPNIVVNVDMGSQLIAKAMGNLRSVYIDNMGSDVPIYVYFPDTQYTVVAQPNSAGWFPVYTNDMKCQVAGLGFLDGDIPSTYILFTNIPVPPSTDIEIQTTVQLWKASAIITRGTGILNTNVGVPALGDQTAGYSNNVAGAGAIQTICGTPYSSGFLYLTHADIRAYGAGGSGPGTVVLESTGSAGILYTFLFIISGNNLAGQLFNLSAMNIKLDATQTYRLRCSSFPGYTFNLSSNFNFTTNPT